MKIAKYIAAAGLAVASVQIASAATIIKTYDFTATDFFADNHSPTIPYATVTGSFTITFDPAISSFDTAFTINSLSIGYDGTASFSYSSALTYIEFGANNQPGVLVGGTNDFYLRVDTAAGTTHTPNFFTYTTSNTNDFFDAGTVIVTEPSAGAVPEPASWAMMVGGFGLLGGVLRNRKRATVRFA